MTDAPTPALPPGFTLAAFAALDVPLLYAILALRQRVFVVEQRCVFLDADGRDAAALHLVHRSDGAVDAYARLFLPSPAAHAPHPVIGRVVTAPEVRGTGLGHRLIDVALDVLGHLAPGVDVHLGAQAHLEGWYGKHGFAVCGPSYLEDDILHVPMSRPSQL